VDDAAGDGVLVKLFVPADNHQAGAKGGDKGCPVDEDPEQPSVVGTTAEVASAESMACSSVVTMHRNVSRPNIPA